MTKKPDDSLLPVTAGDINKLKSMVDDLVERWAEKFLPGEGTPMEPSKSGFPDDDDWEEEYEKFGFSR